MELLVVKRDGVEFVAVVVVAFGYSLAELFYNLTAVWVITGVCLRSESFLFSVTFIYESVLLIAWLPNKEVFLLFAGASAGFGLNDVSLEPNIPVGWAVAWGPNRLGADCNPYFCPSGVWIDDYGDEIEGWLEGWFFSLVAFSFYPPNKLPEGLSPPKRDPDGLFEDLSPNNCPRGLWDF